MCICKFNEVRSESSFPRKVLVTRGDSRLPIGAHISLFNNATAYICGPHITATIITWKPLATNACLANTLRPPRIYAYHHSLDSCFTDFCLSPFIRVPLSRWVPNLHSKFHSSGLLALFFSLFSTRLIIITVMLLVYSIKFSSTLKEQTELRNDAHVPLSYPSLQIARILQNKSTTRLREFACISSAFVGIIGVNSTSVGETIEERKI